MSFATKPPSPHLNLHAVGLVGGVLILIGGLAMAPLAAPPSLAEQRADYAADHPQDYPVSSASAEAASATATFAPRDDFGSTPGPATYIAGGTNYDWASLVLVYAGWPVTESNVTVITRWMRQENGPDDWYNRNNPLNIGAGGFASYASLDEAARVVAKALTNYGGYAQIAAGFAASADTATIEYAIWASPWAGGHYAWGGHWSYTEVPLVSAPRSAWGS